MTKPVIISYIIESSVQTKNPITSTILKKPLHCSHDEAKLYMYIDRKPSIPYLE